MAGFSLRSACAFSEAVCGCSGAAGAAVASAAASAGFPSPNASAALAFPPRSTPSAPSKSIRGSSAIIRVRRRDGAFAGSGTAGFGAVRLDPEAFVLRRSLFGSVFFDMAAGAL